MTIEFYMNLSKIIKLTSIFAEKLNQLTFSEPVTHFYNPLVYAWKAHKIYLERFGSGSKKVFFLGMNPGPWGMAQSGIPFGEVSMVSEWMNIRTKIEKPKNEHPKRPIDGFDCRKSEVSGRRFWGLMKKKFNCADFFFAEHFVGNYCPLVFMEASGKNRTPDKLPKEEKNVLMNLCDRYLWDLVQSLQPRYLIGVGSYAENCLQRNFSSEGFSIGKVLHPSPASPLANNGWEEQATKKIKQLGIW